jgi:uncharacterized protein (DUF58 family)
VRLRPRRRLPGVLVAAGVIYFFATNSGVVWLYLLTALVLALVPVGLLAPVLTIRRLRLGAGTVDSHGFEPPLRRDHARVFSGDRLSLRVAAAGNLDACELGPLLLAGGETRAASRAGGAIEADAGRRGLLAIEAIRASSDWPLGIFVARRELPLALTVVVNPRYCLPRPAQRAGMREPMGASSRRGSGDQFLGLRRYQPGDSQRRIHWPTTARTGELMVIDTALEASSPGVFRLGIDADAGPRSADLAVEVVASLAAGCVAEGRAFRLDIGRERNPGGGWDDALARLSLVHTWEPGWSAGASAVTITASREGVDIVMGDRSRRLPADLSLLEVQATLEDIA